MRRWLFTVLSALSLSLSLLLLVATVTFWVRSTRSGDILDGRIADSDFWISSVDGAIHLSQVTGWSQPSRHNPGPRKLFWQWQGSRRDDHVPATDAPRRRAGGFEYTTGTYPYSKDYGFKAGSQWYRYIIVPYWSLTCAFALLPALAAGTWWRRLRRRRSTRRGMCPACGYDLRATPGRCPECGTVPAGKQA
jgi:hypothetical protein